MDRQTHTHTYNNTRANVQIIEKIHTHPTTHGHAPRIREPSGHFSYSYLHVYESQSGPGIQIYLNSDRIRKYPPPESQERGEGEGEKEASIFI